MAEPITLDKANPLLPAEDFVNLRREGISHIEKLAHDVWTDYNTHDPGITILEAVCYAITDLAYRTSFDMKDLLAPTQLSDTTWKKIFYTARQILPCTPLTITDYRKLIIDTEGIRNAWLEVSKSYEVPLYVNYSGENTRTNPCRLNNDGNPELCKGTLHTDPTVGKIVELNGLYTVILEFEEDIRDNDHREQLKEQIERRLHKNRNLCEDFLTIQTVEYQDFSMDADILLTEDADPDVVLAQVYFAVHHYFSPSVRFYTIDQLLEKGWRVEEIFEGPALRHGFMDTTELEKTDIFRDMRLSDIVNILADIPGIKAIRKLYIDSGPLAFVSDEKGFKQWIKKLRQQRKVARLDTAHSDVLFRKERETFFYGTIADPAANDALPKHDPNKLPQPQNTDRTHKLFRDLKALDRHYKLKGHQRDFPVPTGENMVLEDYFPVMYSFPRCYGLREDELPDSAGQTRLLQAKQLQGYLLFFEQILVNYLAQLNHLNDIFSFDKQVRQTYYVHVLTEIHNIQELLIDYDPQTPDGKFLEEFGRILLAITESQKDFYRRRNQFLNHLLGRFSEDVSEYESLMHTLFPEDVAKRLIRDKIRILSNYPDISNARGRAFNYTDEKEIWNTNNTSGAEERISRLLGFDQVTRRNLAPDFLTAEPLLEKKPNGDWEQKKNIDGKPLVIIKLLDTNDYETVLLTSTPVKEGCCIEKRMDLLIERGEDRKNYRTYEEEIRSSRKSKDKQKGTYWFELTDAEGEKIAESPKYNTLEERKIALEKAVNLFQEIGNEEGLHLVEHILLRPKMDTVLIGTNTDAGDITLAPELLPICLDDCDLNKGVDPYTDSPNYRIQLRRTPDNDCYHENEPWVLEIFRKSDGELVFQRQTFRKYEGLEEQLQDLRFFGADRENYIVFKAEDGKFYFHLLDENEEILARSVKGYSTAAAAEREITDLLDFFAFQQDWYCAEDPCDHNEDPYSFRVTVVLPCWCRRFRDATFRNLVEKTIDLETPAHIAPRVYWLGIEQMRAFEKAYCNWLTELADNPLIPEYTPLNELVTVISNLRECDGCDDDCS